MAKKQQKNRLASSSISSFTETILSISRRFSISQVFEDFLTLTIAACTQNPALRISYYETEYLETIRKYKDLDLRHKFPKALACLIEEVEARNESSLGNDVLGEFFEEHISNGRNGQFFTPYPVCQMMAAMVASTPPENSNEPLRILDPTCGSGRMLLAARCVGTGQREYYGIDIDQTCVKMAAVNLFFNGMWNSEVMCANVLDPNDFVLSYHISLLPLGIFKIQDKGKSAIWHLFQRGLEKIKKDKDFKKVANEKGSQLKLF